MFEFGEVLRDKVTGFKGIVMARTEYWTECFHYGLQSQKLKDGKPAPWQWFDETMVERFSSSKKIIKGPREIGEGEASDGTSGSFPNAPQS